MTHDRPMMLRSEGQGVHQYSQSVPSRDVAPSEGNIRILPFGIQPNGLWKMYISVKIKFSVASKV